MGLQRVGHDRATELTWIKLKPAEGADGEKTKVINSDSQRPEDSSIQAKFGEGAEDHTESVQKNIVRTFEGSGEQLDDFSWEVLSLNCCDSSWWQKDHSVEN